MTIAISLLDSYKKAVYEKNVEAYASLFDEHVRVFDMWDAWNCEGIGPWKEMAERWFAGLGTDRDVVTWEAVEEQAGSDLVVVTAIIRFAAVSSEGVELRYLQNRLT
ncbi:MAG: nuclear transport factor 2 family protein, partial [Bacteroidetes bacterium]|nr:nuclear transport factor 2 family protein [Bacteroidota bacterium]